MTPLPERLFTLLDLLQSHRRLTVSDLATRLDVDERTVRRDAARLQSLGIPVEAVRGRGGGLELPPGTPLPALRFTDDEALALGLGLTLVARVPGLTLKVTSAFVLDLAEAITYRRRAELRYRAPGKPDSIRKLDPYALVQLIGRWYLVGHCHLRGGARTFRLDRLQTLKVLTESFTQPDGFDALAFVSDSVAKTPFPEHVICRALLHTSLEEARRLTSPASAVLEPQPKGVRVTCLVPPDELEAVALHLLHFPYKSAKSSRPS